VLQKVWAASGGQRGRYLAASVALQLDALERHGELVDGQDRYSPAVRAELLAMSSATIDRYLRGAKDPRPDRGEIDHQAFPAAAVDDQDPQGNDEVEAAGRSKSARQPTRSRQLRGSSKATPSRTAGQH